jgi:glycosyltransferase involved in cell wall biosynthesis
MSVVERAPDGQTGERYASRGERVVMHVAGQGRTDVRVLREATALRDAGYGVTLVDIERDGSRPHVETLDGITFRHIVSPGYFRSVRFKPWFLVKMVGITARGAWAVSATPAEIYHAHDDYALPATYVAAQVRNKRLIFDAHELPLGQTNRRGWGAAKAVIRSALRGMAARCAGIITVSAPIADEIHRQFGGPAPTLVRNIPPYRAPDAASDIIRRTLGLPDTARVALYQGAFQGNRSLDVLVRAARYLDDDHIIALMGSGPARAALEALATAEGVGDRVRILPPAPYEELLAWTASADLGLILYRASYSLNVRYCLPNKLFEYLMAGVPVVATELDAVADILRRYDAGVVVDSTEPEVVGRAISATLADAAGRQRMRANALAASLGDLRWEVERERLLALYASIAEGVAGKPARAHILAKEVCE